MLNRTHCVIQNVLCICYIFNTIYFTYTSEAKQIWVGEEELCWVQWLYVAWNWWWENSGSCRHWSEWHQNLCRDAWEAELCLGPLPISNIPCSLGHSCSAGTAPPQPMHREKSLRTNCKTFKMVALTFSLCKFFYFFCVLQQECKSLLLIKLFILWSYFGFFFILVM